MSSSLNGLVSQVIRCRVAGRPAVRALLRTSSLRALGGVVLGRTRRRSGRFPGRPAVRALLCTSSLRALGGIDLDRLLRSAAMSSLGALGH